MQLNVDPGFDADLELAQDALERGWVTRDSIESAILAHERTPGSRLLNHLPLTPDQLQKLLAPEGPMPPEIAKIAQEPARRLDHYILGDFLHSGGMGRVYKAWDLKLSRWVALKCLKAVGDERSEAYFDREARLAAGLSHPNIAAIYESGRAAGESFIAMQLIPGKTLDQWGRRDVPRLVSWIRDAARAVAYANSRGIVHRDLKPTNMMVTPEGQIYVLDFGLARPVALDASHSATGKAMGTPAYMSPEQARGAAVDARSDVYSLGATLFECLTGRAPFFGTTIYDVLRKVEEAAPARPRRLNPRIAPDLETIILKCLEKDAARRYRSADELADDLDRFLNHDAIHARPAGVFYRVHRSLAKRKAIAIASIASVVLAGVMGWWFLVGRPHSEQLRVGAENLALRESAMKLWAEARGAAMSGADPRAVPPKARAAREAFERALAIKEEPLAHLMRGRCLQLESQDEAALKALERAHELDPANSEARIELAKALLTKYQASRGFPANFTATNEAHPNPVHYLRRLPAEEEDQRRARVHAEELLKAGTIPVALTGLLKGLLAMGEGRHASAAEEFSRYTREESWDAQAIWLEGVCRSLAGDYKEAVEVFDRSLRRRINVETLWWRGNSNYRAGLRDEAIADFTKALETDPAHSDSYIGRGLVYSVKGEREKAIADYTRACEVNPRSSVALNNRSIEYHSMGRNDAAIEDCTKAIEMDPGYAHAYMNRGNAKLATGRLDEAIADFKKSIELNPTGMAWYNLGLAHAAKGMPDEAIVDYTRAIELVPTYTDALNNRGAERLDKDLVEEAIADFTRVIELDPSQANAWANRGNASLGKGLLAEAAADWEKALEVAPPQWPNRAEVKRRLANVETRRLFQEAGKLHESRQYRDSISKFMKIVELYPKSRQAIASAYNVACAHALLGEKAKALEWLAKAIDMGWNEPAHLEKDSDLDSLREEAEFKKLLDRLKEE